MPVIASLNCPRSRPVHLVHYLCGQDERSETILGIYQQTVFILEQGEKG